MYQQLFEEKTATMTNHSINLLEKSKKLRQYKYSFINKFKIIFNLSTVNCLFDTSNKENCLLNSYDESIFKLINFLK